ncbi:hypothetical protein MYX04_01170 [Nitrospiraceae bacterium AH_259_D15_M11_P09]|nr:hypothetical protein [Nitrospiraceae bacterium AH_259_D15_M11_P09]
MTATGIVQARMGSERCPGKSMELVGGAPVVAVVLGRLTKAKRLSRVVLATSKLDMDVVLAEKAEALGIPVFRGSEADLVDRFLAAAHKYAETPYIVRATGDNVFVDWNEIDRLVEFGIEGGWDFVGFDNEVYKDRINDFAGEFIKLEALERVAALTDDPYDREHVFPYFYAHPDQFKVTRIQVHPSLHTPVKLDLDYPEDLELLQAIGEEVADPIEVPSPEVVRIASQLRSVSL